MYSIYIFYFQNLNKQAYDLAKALLKRTAQAIEPYITNVSNPSYDQLLILMGLLYSKMGWVNNSISFSAHNTASDNQLKSISHSTVIWSILWIYGFIYSNKNGMFKL